MFKVLGSMLSYDFMIRAIIVGSLVSLCSTLLGTSLVLKRYSMIGDGLSHVGFAALAIAYALQLAPMSVSIPVCVIAAFFLLQLEENSKIKGDAATALLCSGHARLPSFGRELIRKFIIRAKTSVRRRDYLFSISG